MFPDDIIYLQKQTKENFTIVCMQGCHMLGSLVAVLPVGQYIFAPDLQDYPVPGNTVKLVGVIIKRDEEVQNVYSEMISLFTKWLDFYNLDCKTAYSGEFSYQGFPRDTIQDHFLVDLLEGHNFKHLGGTYIRKCNIS